MGWDFPGRGATVNEFVDAEADHPDEEPVAQEPSLADCSFYKFVSRSGALRCAGNADDAGIAVIRDNETAVLAFVEYFGARVVSVS